MLARVSPIDSTRESEISTDSGAQPSSINSATTSSPSAMNSPPAMPVPVAPGPASGLCLARSQASFWSR